METQKNILSFIPQTPPFVMIDKLFHSNETTARTGFRVTDKNILTIGGRFTEAGLMENIAQTAAAGAGYISRLDNKPVKIGYIGAVKNLEIFELPQTNDELITETILSGKVMDVSIVSGKVWCNDRLIAKCEMRIFMA